MESASVTEQLWGGETTKAVDNFPVSGERGLRLVVLEARRGEQADGPGVH